ncbi:MAG: fructose-bisphosphate aldolase class I [Thermoleophilaceae bacterium]|nr:fructose-bisphosphate aldolase class I [Thermoleophilaceae bacterium]
MTVDRARLEETAQAMVAQGKGILAADESNATMTKRLEAVGIESTPDSRRGFRGLMFAAESAADYISGVIMYDETLRQASDDGTPFPVLPASAAILPGIKVDTGAKPLAGFPGETVTEGLDGLRGRLGEYRELGARFAKWRAVIGIGEDRPTHGCIEANAHALARYARLCQEAGIVPIVEPEVLMDGDHSIDRSEEVTATVLRAVFAQLAEQRVLLEGIVLKPNMLLSGYDCPEQASVEEVAERTLACFRRVVPAAVPGIAFLSGGQSDERAAAHLNAMNRIGGVPWELTFSYGRALVAAPLKVWAADTAEVADAQAAFLHRARCNAAARRGEYAESMEHELVA